MSTNGTVNSGDHQWHERREPHLKIDSGDAVLHHHCGRCGRDIVTVLSSGTRHAAYVSMLRFYRLDDEVTRRWLSERCPGARLATDDEDRKMLASGVRRAVLRTKNRQAAKLFG
jgi:hypothetical protein